jgi:hypothetical protein
VTVVAALRVPLVVSLPEPAKILEQAAAAARTVPDATLSSTALRRIAFASAGLAVRAGALEEAERAAAALPARWRDHALLLVAQAQARADDASGAAATLRDALEAAERVRADFRDCAIRKVAVRQTQIGDVTSALASIARIPAGASERAEASRAVASAQAERGDVRSAFAWASALQPPLERAHSLLGIVEGELGAFRGPETSRRLSLRARAFAHDAGCDYTGPIPPRRW